MINLKESLRILTLSLVGILIGISIALFCTRCSRSTTSTKTSSVTPSTLIEEEVKDTGSPRIPEPTESSTTTQEVKVTESTSSEVAEESGEDTAFYYIPLSKELKKHVKEVSAYYNFDEKLIYQIIWVESRYQVNADNGTSVGLMQINKTYASHYLTWSDDCPYQISKDSDIMNPYVNIVLGCRVLSDWRRMTKVGNEQINDLLCYYNMGWSYDKYGSNGYDKKVLETDLESIDFSKYKIIK